MIILAQTALITALEWGLHSWLWVMLVPMAFGMASRTSCARTAGRSAVAGGLTWLLASLFLFLTSGGIIAGRMAAMFGLGRGMGWLMIAFSGLLGALVASLAALAGASLRAALDGTRKLPPNAMAASRQS